MNNYKSIEFDLWCFISCLSPNQTFARYSASTFILMSCSLFALIFCSEINKCRKGIIFAWCNFSIMILKNGAITEPFDDAIFEYFSELLQH